MRLGTKKKKKKTDLMQYMDLCGSMALGMIKNFKNSNMRCKKKLLKIYISSCNKKKNKKKCRPQTKKRCGVCV